MQARDLNLDHLSELLRDSRLQASIYVGDRGLTTVHTLPRGHRGRQRRAIWIQEKKLGQGGQGEVVLERKASSEAGLPQYRAVKRIRAATTSDDLRELEALAKFSKEKVRHMVPYHVVRHLMLCPVG
ncbi:hypothetical protein GGR56DRAFT_322095 [Xylariaceae sp. FL0804]|nr:hypothetical protein GGR56DRAFT_322095 [Xylariaceae sp. FL0804]